MGYYVTLTDAKFFISGEDKFAAYKNLKNIFRFKKARCLEEALEAFCYAPKTDAEDNIVGIDFCCDKLGIDDEKMFDFIAPFVKSGSYIEMLGEDGTRWRWVFENGKSKKVYSKTVWEDE